MRRGLERAFYIAACTRTVHGSKGLSKFKYLGPVSHYSPVYDPHARSQGELVMFATREQESNDAALAAGMLASHERV